MSFAEEEKQFWNELEVLRDQHWLSSSLVGEGQWKFSGQMRFAGQWKGQIIGDKESSLQVLKGAKMEGQIEVPTLVVEGQLIDCTIVTANALFKKGCFVSGKIKSQKISVEEGAKIEADFETLKQ